MCKEILKNALQNELTLFNNTKGTAHGKCGDCWNNNCCFKTGNRICNISVTSRTLTSVEKMGILLQETYFYTILHKIAKDNNLKCDNAIEIGFDTIELNRKIQNMYNNFYNDFQLCKSNIDTYYQMGYNKSKAVLMCKEAGFDDSIIEIAINKTALY